jgi:hypothetical protein
MQIECEEECERRDAFQDGKFDGGWADLEFAMDSKALGQSGTRDAFLARQLYTRRVQSWNATRSIRKY